MSLPFLPIFQSPHGGLKVNKIQTSPPLATGPPILCRFRSRCLILASVLGCPYNGSQHSCLLVTYPCVIPTPPGWMNIVIGSNSQMDLGKVCDFYSFPLSCVHSLSLSLFLSVCLFLCLSLSLSFLYVCMGIYVCMYIYC